MAFHRGGDSSDPVRGERIGHTEHRFAHSPVLAAGTFACPECDAPVSPGGRPLRPMEPVACPYCGHAGAVRDFLSLATPTRPAHVEVRVRPRDSWSRA
jgi:hypothetical protein